MDRKERIGGLDTATLQMIWMKRNQWCALHTCNGHEYITSGVSWWRDHHESFMNNNERTRVVIACPFYKKRRESTDNTYFFNIRKSISQYQAARKRRKIFFRANIYITVMGYKRIKKILTDRFACREKIGVAVMRLVAPFARTDICAL